ncbi:MAG TPA: dipeptide/oligopeptide/nickel ABC transporter ATP-binding protein, partial [Clostridiaceae bacterium]|nr:dipeptide/oligopeptide/nickel ABC transporter ATP-binding protein [Clostridiaceae bacterium]
LHPYTVGLLESKPKINEDKDKLTTIPGQVPNPLNMPEGCYFHPRCSKCMDICKKKAPRTVELENGHKVACWLYDEGVK